jgi:predicted RNase H-like HicB family nuclease
MKIKAVVWQEDGVWCGSVPALPGCHTWGESYEQLLEMLEDAVQGWLEVASERSAIAMLQIAQTDMIKLDCTK